MINKFKIGDTVEVTGANIDDKTLIGRTGIIREIDEDCTDGFPYRVNDIWSSVKKIKKVITKDSGKRLEFKSGMVRDVEEDKPMYDLVYMPMLKRWAELMTRGAKKYGRDNWKKANGEEELTRFKASALRHMIQYFEGEDDEDHASAVFFNISGAEYVKAKMKKNV